MATSMAPGFISASSSGPPFGLRQWALHLENDIGIGQGRSLVRRYGRSGIGEGLIGDRGFLTGTGFDNNVQPKLLILLDGIGGCRNAAFVGAPLLGYRDFHPGWFPCR